MKEVKHPNFLEEDRLYLVRCPKCDRENYSFNVAIGICTWCGLDGYKYYEIERPDSES
jgi:ribosomal protein L37E